MESVILNITGMACGGCASTVTKALQSLPGVATVEVSYVEARAEISFDPALVQVEQLRAAIEWAGYHVLA